VGPGDLHNPTFNGVVAEFLQDDNSDYEHCRSKCSSTQHPSSSRRQNLSDAAIYTERGCSCLCLCSSCIFAPRLADAAPTYQGN
jgi:hypothetical protein